MTNFSALIIDDELENINLVTIYLKKYFKEINTIYSSITLEGATELFLAERPNILILDINLGNGCSSFDLLENYNMGLSEVIFITSYDQFAIKAINNDNVSAYLIKPIKINEFVKSVNKAIAKIMAKTYSINFLESKINSNLIAIPAINRIDLISMDEIIYCSADGKYTNFYTSGEKIYTSCRNLGEYQEILNPNFFFRIHHKYIVNINFVTSINKSEGYYCELFNGKNLPVSSRKQEDFNRFIKLKF